MPTQFVHHQPSLPQPPVRLLGRDRDTRATIELVTRADVRLVTLTGPGGVGKTHLALEVAALAAGAFPDGTAFVPLAAISDEQRVLPSIAEALGIRHGAGHPHRDRLVNALRHREMLIILDNFEQILGAAPEIGGLISACPSLTFLATSRSPLRLRAEREYPVAPLELPTSETATVAVVEHNASVSLFLERARAVRPGFELTESSAPAVAEICRRLDGLPLAIELAAAMMRILSPQTLLARMTHRLALLANGPADLPDRHRTLRRAIAWSYDLLTPEEQRLFRRLAVFSGGATLAAIEAMLPPPASSDEDATLALVASLVDKSLLDREVGSDDDPRFAMLSTIQEYATERLAAIDDPISAWRAHLDWCLAFAQVAEPELTGPRQAHWLDQLDRERENLRAALSRSFEIGATTGLELATALWRYWSTRGSLPEGYDWLSRLIDRTPDAPDATRARAFTALGNIALDLGDYEAAYGAYGQALALWEQHQSPRGIADALNGLGLVDWYRGEMELAKARHQRSLHLRRALGDRRGEANSLTNLANALKDAGDATSARHLHHQALAIRAELGDRGGVGYSALNLGDIARRAGDAADARAWLEESLAAFREVGDALGVGYALQTIGLVAIQGGQLRQASRSFADALTVRRNLGDRRGMIECVEGIASVAGLSDRSADAARLFGAAQAQRARIAAPLPEPELVHYRPILDGVRQRLGDDSFVREMEEGSGLELEDVVTRATMIGIELAAAPASAATPLSARELEVVRLIAAGLTNAQAADQLFLSRRTVDAHMRRIYDKLRLGSRGEVVRFALQHGLV